jgi:hypothetical protein
MDNFKYIIKFDCDYLPNNFVDEWIKCDKNNNYTNAFKLDDKIYFCEPKISIKKYTNDKYINLYLPTIIESYLHDFEVEYGGTNYVFEKGRIYFPVFSGIHQFNLKINDGVVIYRDSNDFRKNDMFNILYEFSVIFDKIKILKINNVNFDEKDKKLILRYGLSGIGKYGIVDADKNEFYEELKNKNKIPIFDKYIESNVISIYLDIKN